MTLQEALDAILERYPHSQTSDNVIKKINIVLRELFRTIYKPETSTTYDLIADNAFYPIEYSPENIIDVVVKGTEYPYQNIKYDSLDQFYYITEDNCIGLYPTPSEDVTDGLTVFRYREPSTLTTSNLGEELDFDKAFHMLIVYRVCKDLAEIDFKGDMVQNFASQYNGLEREYLRSKRARPHKILDVYGGCNW